MTAGCGDSAPALGTDVRNASEPVIVSESESKPRLSPSAFIAEGSIVGAASFVPYRAQFPPGSLIVGSPARLVRPLEEAEREYHRIACEKYLQLVDEYRAGKWREP